MKKPKSLYEVLVVPNDTDRGSIKFRFIDRDDAYEFARRTRKRNDVDHVEFEPYGTMVNASAEMATETLDFWLK